MSASTSGRSASATPSFCEAASSDRMLEEKCGPRLRVDLVGDARRLEPFLPGVAAGHDLHRVVVQQRVVREVGGLLQRRIALDQLRARHRDHRHAEQAVGAVAGILARRRGGSGRRRTSVRRSRSPISVGRVERAGVDHLAGGDHAQLDLRLALREVGEARHQPARGEHRRRGDHQLGLVAALADHLHRRGERVEALAQARQAGARRLGELHAARRRGGTIARRGIPRGSSPGG